MLFSGVRGVCRMGGWTCSPSHGQHGLDGLISTWINVHCQRESYDAQSLTARG
jgi:hypothetical protein